MKLSPLQFREVFHLEFLRELVRKIPASAFVLKGGSNLRFFFGSIRYSEDMDLDAGEITVEKLKERTLAILDSKLFVSRIRSFGIDDVIPPDMRYAKQTQTVQRFKIHLITSAGEDFFTKVEFSRRGFDTPRSSEAVEPSVLAQYYLPPLIVPHYLAEAAARQKFRALLSRRHTEARDIFDLYVLSPRISDQEIDAKQLPQEELEEMRERIYSVEYRQYCDQVLSFLSLEDRAHYSSRSVWDEIRLTAISLLEKGLGNNG